MNPNVVTEESNQTSHPILIGLTYTIVLVIIATFIFAFIIYFTALSDNNISILSLVSTTLSVMIGGFISGKKAGKKGWLYGGTIGFIYAIILGIITFLAFNVNIDLRYLVLLAISTFSGALGGILGVNYGNK
ncbi:MAG: TIGR04086 family membrane protein [Vulcanibacillus sp.]